MRLKTTTKNLMDARDAAKLEVKQLKGQLTELTMALEAAKAPLIVKEEELNKALKAAKDALATSDQVVKEVCDSAMRVLNEKEEEVTALKAQIKDLDSQVATVLHRTKDWRMSRARKSLAHTPFQIATIICLES